MEKNKNLGYLELNLIFHLVVNPFQQFFSICHEKSLEMKVFLKRDKDKDKE